MEVSLDRVKDALVEKVGKHFNISAEESAESIIRVADSNMNNALKLISVRRGYDPRDFAMVAFEEEVNAWTNTCQRTEYP